MLSGPQTLLDGIEDTQNYSHLQMYTCPQHTRTTRKILINCRRTRVYIRRKLKINDRLEQCLLYIWNVTS